MTKQQGADVRARRGSSGNRSGASASANQEETPTVDGRRHRSGRPQLERLDALDAACEPAAAEDNQEVVGEYENVSLELLALLSPHGTTQQWENEDDTFTGAKDDLGDRAKRLSMLARTDLTEYSGLNQKQPRELPDLTSPTQHMVPFQASPTHSAHGDELDLASPVALPESPQSQSLWENEVVLAMEFDEQDSVLATEGAVDPTTSTMPSSVTTRSSPSTLMQRVAQKSGRSPTPSHARTPGKTESKPKARHGGIYSLLLKNKPPEQEPMLVDEKRSPLGPEVSPGAHSVSKNTSPPPIGKLQHGGIYGMLRRTSKGDH